MVSKQFSVVLLSSGIGLVLDWCSVHVSSSIPVVATFFSQFLVLRFLLLHVSCASIITLFGYSYCFSFFECHVKLPISFSLSSLFTVFFLQTALICVAKSLLKVISLPPRGREKVCVHSYLPRPTMGLHWVRCCCRLTTDDLGNS